MNSLEMEPFLELFADNVYYVGPYSQTEAWQMLGDWMERNGLSYAEAAVDYLLYVTACYAGLLRAAARSFQAYTDQPLMPQAQEDLLAALAGKPSECRTIWTSLMPAEQYVLKAVARLTPYAANAETEDAVTMLVQKLLLQVDRERQRLEIEPPLFRAFVGRFVTDSIG